VLNIPLSNCALEDSMVLNWCLAHCKNVVPRFFISDLRKDFKIDSIKEIELIIKAFAELDRK
jgi:hypothetical protein